MGGPAGKASLLGALMHPPPPPGTSAKPKASAPGPKGSPRRKDEMGQLLEMVTALTERVGRMESRGDAAPPIVTMPSSPAAPPMYGVGPGVYPMPGAQVDGRLHPVAAPHMAMPTSSLLQPGRVLQPGSSFGAPAGGNALGAAQHALAGIGPPGVTQGARGPLDDLAGGVGRRRAKEVAIRMAVERGGEEAHSALQLATLEALERLQQGRSRNDDPLDVLGEDDLDGELNKLTTGEKGVYGLQRIMQSIENQPLRWCAICDDAMARSLGTHTTGMPWSAQRYGTERIRFQRFPDLERFWSMLACLHALHRADGVCLRVMADVMDIDGATRSPAWKRDAPGPGHARRAGRGDAVGQGHESGGRDHQEGAWSRRADIRGAGWSIRAAAEESSTTLQEWWKGWTVEGRSSGPPVVTDQIVCGELPVLDLAALCGALEEEFANVCIPKNHTRANILSRPGVYQRSLLLGAFTSKGTGVTAATKSARFARLLALVHMAAKMRVEDAPYSGVMLNQDVATETHRDAPNVTLNDVLVLGEFTGGDIIVECDGGPLSLSLPDGQQVAARCLQRPGPVGWVTFDATRWHRVTESTGSRLSIVLFCGRGLQRLTDADWDCMSVHGFRADELRQIGALEMEVKSPSRPLNLDALRGRMLALGLIQQIAIAESADVSPGLKRRQPWKARERMKTSCSGRAAVSSLLRGEQVHVYQLMCALPFCSLPSDFGYFFGRVRGLLNVHGLEKARSMDASSATQGRKRRNQPVPLFPCGLPYPEVYLRADDVPVSGRRRSRYHRERSLRITVNQMMLYASWLAVGRSCGDLAVSSSLRPLSSLQWKLVGQLRSDLLRVCRPEETCVLEGGGHERLEKTLRGLEEQAPYSVHASTELGTEVVSLSASNMALPIDAAKIELTWPRVPRIFERILHTPHVFDLPLDRVPSSVPRFHMAVDSWPQVAMKLWDAGLVGLKACRDEFVTQRAGLFGVPKKGTSQVRMICDRRQRNAMEKTMFEVLAEVALSEDIGVKEFLFYRRLCLLPHPSQLAELMAPGDASILGSSEDATDYFHLIRAPQCRSDETIIGWPLYRRELSERMLHDCMRGAGDDDSPHFNCHMLSTPMGDQKSMDIAQMLHVWTLVSRGVLRADESWMSYRYGAPSGPHWGGCYCDDLGVVSVISQSLEYALGLAAGGLVDEHREMVSKARRAYNEVGIVRKEAKAVECEQEVSVWGSVVSSARQDVGGNLEKQKQLVGATVRVINSRSVTVGQMEKLVGCWTFHLLYQRSSLCLLSAVYRWLEERRHLRPKGTSYFVTREVRDEMIGLTTLWCLCRSRFTDVIFDQFVCTDAATSWGGAVCAPLSIDQAVWLWSRRRGHHYPMAGSVEEAQEGVGAILRDPSLEEVVAGLPFVETL
eukprot:2994411-Amphidinium_carterae.1